MPRLLARAQVSRGDDDTAAPSAPDLTALRTFRDAMQTRTFAGFPIVIENDIGSTRSWVDRTGNVGRTTMLAPYGYIDGAIGADGDEVDVYLGPDENAAWVYVVHQHAPPDFVAYDEDKVMLGYPSSAAAERAYLAQYTDPRFFGGMSQMSVADFRAALETSDGAAITHRLDSGELDFAKQLIDEAGKNMRRELTPEEIEKLARFFSREASQAQRRDLARQLSAALGIDVVPDEKYIPEVLDYFVHENATLIGSIPEDLHREVANLTARAFTKRMDPEIYGKLIQDRFNVAENRARFIARDQLGKLWGQLNAVRQRGVGVQHFFWETRRDSLVRPSHRALQGHRISYDEPPAVGLPGEDFGCRCGARPDVSNIVAAAASLRTSAGGHAAPIYGG
jgi:SPP1 gp7 family putative phage head morphogenesis protein